MASPTLTELEEELKRDPRSRRFFDLAREYQRSGRLAEAMGLCEKGLNSYPNHWQARLLLAQIYVTKGNLEEGRDMVGKVLLAMHDSVPANHLAAEIYWALGTRTGPSSTIRSWTSWNRGGPVSASASRNSSCLPLLLRPRPS